MNNRVEATYVASYTKRDVLVSRDASALAGSVGVTFKELDAVASGTRRITPYSTRFHLDQADIARW